MSELPPIAPIELTTSSGNDVPTPTITAPITKSEILKRLAIVTAPATSQSALNTITAKQMRRYKYSIIYSVNLGKDTKKRKTESGKRKTFLS
jgi:hypothetical protein